MAIISILILLLFVISALLLMAVVLIQDDQGGGIGGMFGGGSSTAFGARTGNVMTRLTTVLAIIFFASAFALAWMNRTPDSGNVIGRARAERMRNVEQIDWWIEAPAADSFNSLETPLNSVETMNAVLNQGVEGIDLTTESLSSETKESENEKPESNSP